MTFSILAYTLSASKKILINVTPWAAASAFPARFSWINLARVQAYAVVTVAYIAASTLYENISAKPPASNPSENSEQKTTYIRSWRALGCISALGAAASIGVIGWSIKARPKNLWKILGTAVLSEHVFLTSGLLAFEKLNPNIVKEHPKVHKAVQSLLKPSTVIGSCAGFLAQCWLEKKNVRAFYPITGFGDDGRFSKVNLKHDAACTLIILTAEIALKSILAFFSPKRP